MTILNDDHVIMVYFPFGGLLPRPPPEGFPVWLGPLSGLSAMLNSCFNK